MSSILRTCHSLELQLFRVYHRGMKLSETAAAYGLFQLVYADAIDHLAFALFRFRQRNEPDLTFEIILRERHSDILKRLKNELGKFEGEPAGLAAVNEARETIFELKAWRDVRIHARVRLTEQGYELYDRKSDGGRLEMTLGQIEQKSSLPTEP